MKPRQIDWETMWITLTAWRDYAQKWEPQRGTLIDSVTFALDHLSPDVDENFIEDGK